MNNKINYKLLKRENKIISIIVKKKMIKILIELTNRKY
jgi:hypothetical protein